MPPPLEASGGAPAASDIGIRPEARYTREQVIGAFNKAHNKIATIDNATLNPQERWAKKAAQAGKEKMLDKEPPTDKFENTFTSPDTGQEYHQNEGVALEQEFFDLLQKQIDALPADNPERAELEESQTILLANSKAFPSIGVRMRPDRLVGRTTQEAYSISQDPEMATGSTEGDYFKARDLLMRRRELRFPPIAGGAGPATPDTTTPDATAPDITPSADATVDTPPLRPEDERFDVVAVNTQSGIITSAQFEARKDVTDSLGQHAWWKLWRWPQKIGLRFIEPGEVQRRRMNLQKIMVQNNTSQLTNNIVRGVAGSLNQAREEGKLEQQAVVTRFKAGPNITGEESITAEGELRTQIINEVLAPITRGEITTNEQIREKMSQFVKDHLNDPQVERLFGASANNYGEIAEYFATDLLETGLRMKNHMEVHGKNLAQIDGQINIRLGNAGLGTQTETRDAVVKAIAWANRRRSKQLARAAEGLGYRGIILNPTVVGIAASLGTAGIMRAMGYANKLAVPVSVLSGGLSGAVVGGARRYHELGVYDRPQHMVERALGEEVPEVPKATGVRRIIQRATGQLRREDLKGFEYDTKSATELRTNAQETLNLDLSTGDSETQLRNVENVARVAAEIQTRLNLSHEQHIDLITFENKLQVNIAPTQLLQDVVNLRQKLQEHFVARNLAAGQSETDALTNAQTTITELSTRFQDDTTRRLLRNREQQDRHFQHYRLRNAAGAAVFGGVAGIGGAIAGQEALALAGRAFPVLEHIPIIGGVFKKGDTVLEKVLQGKNYTEWFDSTRATGFAKDTAQELFNKPGNTEIAPGIQLVTQADHSASLIDVSKSTVISSGRLDQDGHLFVNGRPNALDARAGFLNGPDYQQIVHEDPNLNATKLKELYNNHPATVKVSDNLTMRVGRVIEGVPPAVPKGEGFVQAPDHFPVTFVHNDGTPVDMPPAYLSPDGKIEVSGDASRIIDPDIKKFLTQAEWQNAPSHAPTNLHEAIQKSIQTNHHDVFRHGNTEISVNPDVKTFSIRDFADNVEANGTIDTNGNLIIDRGGPGNTGITPAQWENLGERLYREGWGIDLEKTAEIKGTGTVIDQLLSNVDSLKGQNIIETDQFKKSWNFHVLRPDIVSATGQHTHNELTLHVGGSQIQVLTDKGVVMRPGVGPIGQVNFGGEIHGGLIQSHLAGVDPKADPVLNALMQKSGGLRLNEMVAVVDLTNDKQIMLPLDASGNVQLPKELYDPTTGSPRGVKSIAAAVLQKQDGTIFKSQELLTGGKVPDGAVVHSLASERFAEGTVPPAPSIPGKEMVKISAPNLTEYAPPADKTFTEFIPKEAVFNEPPPIIPIPFTPRHPLQPLITPEPEPIIGGPYEGGYGDADNEGLRQETREAINRLEPFIRTNPMILDDEKDEALEQVKNYLNSSQAQRLGPQQSGVLFQQMWGFVTAADYDALKTDDGTVTDDIKNKIHPILAPTTLDDTEKEEITQVIGKFLVANPTYTSDEQHIQVLIRAYQTTRSIISPI